MGFRKLDWLLSGLCIVTSIACGDKDRDVELGTKGDLRALGKVPKAVSLVWHPNGREVMYADGRLLKARDVESGAERVVFTYHTNFALWDYDPSRDALLVSDNVFVDQITLTELTMSGDLLGRYSSGGVGYADYLARYSGSGRVVHARCRGTTENCELFVRTVGRYGADPEATYIVGDLPTSMTWENSRCLWVSRGEDTVVYNVDDELVPKKLIVGTVMADVCRPRDLVAHVLGRAYTSVSSPAELYISITNLDLEFPVDVRPSLGARWLLPKWDAQGRRLALVQVEEGECELYVLRVP